VFIVHYVTNTVKPFLSYELSFLVPLLRL
jgi:hypothetical protein